MASKKDEVKSTWSLFSAQEKRNIIIYIIGIVLYKFGLEAFNGSIITLATNRYDQDASKSKIVARTFERVGLLAGLNQASQCIGSIFIAPLIKHWPTRTVLSGAIFLFAVFTAILMILDASTGGQFLPKNFKPTSKNDFSYYGHYNTDMIIPIYCMSGITYGMIELIHRVIPRDIVGDNNQKLQKMDALVHIFYAIAGASGAFTTGLILIPRLGNNYAFIITPIFFGAAGLVWLFISSLGFKKSDQNDETVPNEEKVKRNYLKSVIKGLLLFIQSVYIGGKIIFTNRQFIWLWSCYSLSLYAHRYFEDGIMPQIGRRYLGNSAWSEIIIGGSNFGELLGSLAVFLTTNLIGTPLPWIRLHALMLLIIWYIPFYSPPLGAVKYAWIIAATFMPISFGWAASDVSLVAHIQSSMSSQESKHKDISALGAVMAFLYSSYIAIYAIANPLLGKYIDGIYNSHKTLRPALLNTAAVQLTVIGVVIFASTFIPKGAIALNPVALDQGDLSSISNSADNLDVQDVQKEETSQMMTPV